MFGNTQSNAQIYDLSLSQSVDKDNIGIGNVVTFTILVDHEAGNVVSGITDNTVTYELATDYYDSQELDFFHYELCNGQGCEEAKVTVTVDCAPIKVFNAMSLNRDDINDYSKVEGLEAYPDNELKICSRFSKLLYEKASYDNSWGSLTKRYVLLDLI